MFARRIYCVPVVPYSGLRRCSAFSCQTGAQAKGDPEGQRAEDNRAYGRADEYAGRAKVRTEIGEGDRPQRRARPVKGGGIQRPAQIVKGCIGDE